MNNPFLEITSFLDSQGISFKPSTSSELVVQQCPLCHSGTEEPSNQNKLYINHQKMTVYCHRCQEGYSWFKWRSLISGESTSKTEDKNLPKHIRIWDDSIPVAEIDAKVGRDYLQSRGLKTPVSNHIRFHKDLAYYEGIDKQGSFPALVLAIRNREFQIQAIQVIYLSKDGRKAEVNSPKKIMGTARGGYLILGDPSSTEIATAEGFETSLAVREGTDLTTYCTFSAGNLKAFEVPKFCKAIHIFADQDRSNTGEKAAIGLAEKLHKAKVKTYLHVPSRNLLVESQTKSIDWLDIFVRDPNQLAHTLCNTTEFDPVSNWPKPMGQNAHHGLIGEYVRAVLPLTESDPHAIIVQLLVLTGTALGKSAYIAVGSLRHYTNLFTVIAGGTALGRKGTSLSDARLPFSGGLLNDFLRKRKVSGSSTGEGIINLVHDKIEKEEDERDKNGKVIGKKTVVVSEGIEDKRLLLVEQEFQQVIAASSRSGNNLSAILRLAWDGDDLHSISKSQPQTATAPHISMIGHITPEELVSGFSSSNDATNGLGNRILWCLCKRSKLIPIPPDMTKIDLESFRQKLVDAYAFAGHVQGFQLAKDAEEYWKNLYLNSLNNEKSGLFGKVTSRGQVQVLRIALIYAILDLSPQISETHLRAAMDVWSYCEQSAAHLFGGIIDNSDARKILKALEINLKGMTRSEVRGLFSNHRNADEISTALEILHSEGLIECEYESNGGRPTERWFVI